MNATINLDDYITEEEKKQIAIDLFKNEVLAEIRKAPERIFSNAAYHVVFQMVNDSIDGDTAEIIRAKAVQIIDGLSEQAVFRKADAWHNKESEAYRILNATVIKNQEVLERKIVEHLECFDSGRLKQSVGEAVKDIVSERLFGSLEEQ
jgi:hypothetical protein